MSFAFLHITDSISDCVHFVLLSDAAAIVEYKISIDVELWIFRIFLNQKLQVLVHDSFLKGEIEINELFFGIHGFVHRVLELGIGSAFILEFGCKELVVVYVVT